MEEPIYDGDLATETEAPTPPLSYSDDKKIDKITNNTVQWLVAGKRFFPIGKTMSKLPSGYYIIKWENSISRYVPELTNVENDELLILPDPSLGLILTDIKSFWEREAHYRKRKYTYKRNILLYGDPGNGKSSVISLLCQILIKEYEGIVITIKSSDDIQTFPQVLADIQEIEPTRKIIAIIEDLDNFVSSDRNVLTQLLNILDGNLQFKNLVVLGTTNYPEKLESRLSNRPSRFDRRFEIQNPNYEVRKFYIENKLEAEDLETIDVEKWVKETENFSIDHLKELIISVFVLGYQFDEAHSIMMEFVKTKTLRNTEKNKMGFNSKNG
jgi:Cdc6-like AAA superfamily ATPase